MKSELLKLADVTRAEVQLNAPQATITMQKHIPATVLQEAVNKAGAQYVITDLSNEIHRNTAATDEGTGNSYFPVFFIFGKKKLIR